jgi:hypothetical protein
VDPGVGTARRPLALRLDRWIFVGPDNGLFTLLLDDADKHNWPVEIVHLTNPRYWLPSISATFHGRDIFAPVAAHMANGVPLLELGVPIDNPVRLEISQAEATTSGWHAHIIGIDCFGNLTTDLMASEIAGREGLIVRIRECEIHGAVRSYNLKPPGELIALVDSSGRLEVAVVNGSAAQRTGSRIGDTVEVFFK